MKALILKDNELTSRDVSDMERAFDIVKERWDPHTKVQYEIRGMNFGSLEFEIYKYKQADGVIRSLEGIKKSYIDEVTRTIYKAEPWQWDVVIFWVDNDNWTDDPINGWGMGQLFNNFGIVQMRELGERNTRNVLEHELQHLTDDFYRVHFGVSLDRLISNLKGILFDWDRDAVHGNKPPWGSWDAQKKRWYYKPEWLHTFDAMLQDFGVYVRLVYEKRKQLAIEFDQARISLLLQIKALLIKYIALRRKQEVRAYVTEEEEVVEEDPVRVNYLVKMAEAIKAFEGWEAPNPENPRGSRSYRNNNPGNLRGQVWVTYHGAIGLDHKNFAIFPTYEHGWNKLLFQLEIAATGRSKVYNPEMSLTDFFKVYAPASDDNHPQTYANYVAKFMGLDVSTKLKFLI